jgi:hypothetical protein
MLKADTIRVRLPPRPEGADGRRREAGRVESMKEFDLLGHKSFTEVSVDPSRARSIIQKQSS